MTALPIAQSILPPPALAAPQSGWRRIISFPNLLTLLYLIICGTLTFRHVMWLDEAQAFLLARDSHSFGELFHNLRYEGHPPLWHLLLFVLTRFTTHPEAMQALHLFLAAGSVYLVARFSPLPLIAKALFPFGYFPLFEYGIIARNYQLVMLLTFAFCALWQRRRTAYAWLSVILALLCLTHVLGLIIAAALGVMLLCDALFTAEGRTAIRRGPVWFLLGLLIAAGGAALSLKLMIPPADYSYAQGWRLDLAPAHVQTTLTGLWDGLMPIPSRQVHFWDYHLFVFSPEEAPGVAWAGVALAMAALLLLCRSWRAVVFFLISALGQLAFNHIKFAGGTRHHGGLFITLIAAFWIAWAFRPPLSRAAPTWRIALHLAPQLALTLFLAVHLYSGLVAAWFAWQVPFTAARQAADALRSAMGPDDLLVSESQIMAAPLAIYLPGHQFYFPQGDRWGTFTLWRKEPPPESGVAAARRLAQQTGHPVILNTTWRIPRLPPDMTEIGYFDQGILEMERYGLYRIAPPPSPFAPAGAGR